ncbi:CBS domain-containing protein [Acidimicrobiaceae bacterium]|jgi:signal-transduction protein with cAMP-binding, CBS, and nucleotidyltransferase domain|nr:CBS domain-containing protein [Acidimicrobiaceae bacterium]
MQVAELLRSKGSTVATVTSETTIDQIIEVLRSANIGAVIVSTDGEAIEGIVSERDIVRALHPSIELSKKTASEIMTSDVITCSMSDHLDALMSLMTERRIRHLPVAVDGVLAGIVNIGDVVKHRVNELEHEAQALTEYIQHGR